MIELPGYIHVPQSVIDQAMTGQPVCVRNSRGNWWVVYRLGDAIDTTPKDEWDLAPAMGYLDIELQTWEPE